ncbi:GtrA family protein [Candidatus Dojkabacteria bacterium]|nr:GtrA family protein [Candidatus Dojkabacteria bacterium]
MWYIIKYNTSTFARIFKYTISGVITAITQYLIVLILIVYLGFNTNILVNIANVISIVFALFIAFLLHSNITWRNKYNSYLQFLKKLLIFYQVSIISIVLRVGLFYILNILGIDYRINVLIGIFLIILINFFSYDRIVFKKDGSIN